MNLMDPRDTVWRKSSYSSATSNNCVEVATLPGACAVRDSKCPDGAALIFPPAEWSALLAGLKGGDL